MSIGLFKLYMDIVQLKMVALQIQNKCEMQQQVQNCNLQPIALFLCFFALFPCLNGSKLVTPASLYFFSSLHVNFKGSPTSENVLATLTNRAKIWLSVSLNIQPLCRQIVTKQNLQPKWLLDTHLYSQLCFLYTQPLENLVSDWGITEISTIFVG